MALPSDRPEPFNLQHGVLVTDPNIPQRRTSASLSRLLAMIASFLITGALGVRADEPDPASPPTQQDAQPASTGPRDGDSSQDPGPPGEAQDGAHSRNPGPPGDSFDWKFTVGVGTVYSPSFAGAKEYQALALPTFRIEYKDRFFASIYEGASFNLIHSNGWRAGPLAKVGFGRDEKDDNPFQYAGQKSTALLGLGDVPLTVELGGFVEYSFSAFSTSVQLRQALGGHDGLVAEAEAKFGGMLRALGPPIFFSVGPKLTFADSNHNNAFFGIDTQQSASSGLPVYEAETGLVSYGLGSFALMPVAENVSLGLLVNYERLASEAADSPLIRQRGDQDQFVLGLLLGYQFGF